MENNIQDTITEKIKAGNIKMKSKSYFIKRAFFFALAAFILLLFSIFISSFIIFYLRISGILFLPEFGYVGIKNVFLSLPWLLISFSIIMILFLELFAEKFEFVYKRPALYSLLGIILFTLIASWFIAFSSFHTTLLKAANEEKLPIIGPFYREYASPKFKDFQHGIVTKMNKDGFNITTPDGRDLFIVADKKIREIIKEGNPILIMGKRNNQKINALKIRKMNESESLFPHYKKRMKEK